MRVLVWYPGASVAVHELADGLAWGLAEAGCAVAIYDSSRYLPVAAQALELMGREVGRQPTWIEACYQASLGVYDAALRRGVDWVIMVSALYQPLDYVIGLQRAGIPVCAVLCESPYALDRELRVAAVVDAAVVMERSVVDVMRTVVDQVEYLPHGYDPRYHRPSVDGDPEDVPHHAALSIGTGWPERWAWYDAVRAAGVDLALYGAWESLPADHPLRAALRGSEIPNVRTAAYYRRARVVLNRHRTAIDYEGTAHVWRSESVNPRVYEALACGTLPISDPRPEMREIWPDGALPVATTPEEMAALALRAIEDPVWRSDTIANAARALHRHRWDVRAARVAEALERWRPRRRRERGMSEERHPWRVTMAATADST